MEEVLRKEFNGIAFDKVPSDKLDYTAKNVIVVTDTAKKICAEYFESFSPSKDEIKNNHYYFVYFTKEKPSSEIQKIILSNHPIRY